MGCYDVGHEKILFADPSPAWPAGGGPYPPPLECCTATCPCPGNHCPGNHCL